MPSSVLERRIRPIQRPALLVIARVCAALCVLIGSLVLLGWLADVAAWRLLHPQWVSMKANSGLCLLLCGTALFCCTWRAAWPPGLAAAAAAMLLAGATGLQYVLDRDFAIDQWLAADTLADTGSPGRMAQLTALNYVVMALALALRLWAQRPQAAERLPQPASPVQAWPGSPASPTAEDSSPGLARAVQFLAAFAGVGSLLVVVGYAYGEPALFQLASLEAMALHSALGFCLLAFGLLCATPQAPLVRTIIGDSTGSLLARVYLPVLVALPLVLGWLRLHGQGLGWFSPTAGTALLVVALSTAFGVVTFWVIARLDREEQARRQQGTLLEQVFDTMGEAVAVVDAWGRFTHINRRFTEMVGPPLHGAEPREWLAKYGLLDPDTLQPLTPERSLLARVLAGEPQDEARVALRRPGETAVRYHVSTMRALRDEAGQVTGAVVVARDVTEAEQARERIERSRHEDQTHGEALGLFNEGRDRARLLPALLELLARRHPLPASAFYRYDEWLGAYVLEAHHGTTARLAIEIRPGEGLVGQAAQDGRELVLTDALGGLELDVGFARLQPQAIVVLPVRHAHMRHGLLLLASTQAVDERTLAFLSRLSTQLGLTLHNQRQYDSVKQLAAELRRRSDEVADKNRQLEAADRLKSEFLANMSHELRTPLNAILGFSQVLESGLAGELTGRQRDAIGSIHASGEHLLSLINDILDLSKIEAGHMTLEAECVDLRAAAAGATHILRDQAHAGRVALSLAGGEQGPPLRVMADPRKLKQILYNLMSNAVKFTREGGRVEVSLARASGRELAAQSPQLRLGAPLQDAAQYAGIVVQDSGIGISQAGLSRLFQPFVQLDSSLARQYSGTGLGLALVRRLVELHQGCVTVDSTPGQGSRFTAWLRMEPQAAGEAQAQPPGLGTPGTPGAPEDPASPPASPPAAPPARTDAPAGTAAAAGGGAAEAPLPAQPDQPAPRAPLVPQGVAGTPAQPAARAGRGQALIVEDDPLAADMLRALLQQEGFDSVVVPSGEQALEQVRLRRYDLVTLDLMLPGIDGWQTLDKLQAEPLAATTPVVIVSIIARDHERRGVSLGARGVLQKPVRRDEFMAVLDELGLRGDTPVRRNVLIIDDDPGAVDILRSYLQGEPGVQVQVAYGGEEGITAARRLLPDLIVLDLMMPEVTGFDVVEALQDDPRAAAIPLLVVTAKQLVEDDHRRLRGRVRRVLDKGGFSSDAFLAEIRRAVGGPPDPGRRG